jgi:hypothetical protein
MKERGCKMDAKKIERKLEEKKEQIKRSKE